MRLALLRGALCLGVLSFGTGAAAADAAPDGSGNVLPGCYQYAKIARPANATANLSELFVVIDQTTPFTADLRQLVGEQIVPLLQPGNDLSVYVFSAFTQGHYTRRLVHAEMTSPLPQEVRNDTGKALLEKFDQCLAFQAKSIRQVAGETLRSAFGESSSDIAKSDVLASLRDIATQVKASKARRKIVLLASDMLENSSISSFYARNAVRKIDPAQELKRLNDHQLSADFGGADVYIIGAGLIEEKTGKSGVYRDPQTMRMLETFWRQYFEAANARVVEFGAPALLGRIR